MVRQADVNAAVDAGNPPPRERIMAHMNGDHQRELSLYLQHYAGLGRQAAASPWLKDATFEGMTIAAGGLGGKEFFIAFDPPLKAWSDLRPAVVEMARVAQEALGYSDIIIEHFETTSGVALATFASVAFYFFCWSTLGFVLPGTPIWGFLQAVFPGGPMSYRWLVRSIFFPVLFIHLGEAFWFHRTRLVRHGVETGSSLWWTWIGSIFFEGYPGFVRFDAIVAAAKERQDAKSH